MGSTWFRREALAWMIVGLAAILFSFYHTGISITNDGFQYLSTAQNLTEGNGLSTSIIHFDEQRYSGKIPAPQTVFPFGFPTLIALLVLIGVPLNTAGLIVSMASSVILIPVFIWCCVLLDIRIWVVRLLTLFLVINAAFLSYSSSVISEPLFELVALTSLALFLRAEAEWGRSDRTLYQFLGGILLGLGCWIRYAGFFFVAAPLLHYGLRFLHRRDWKSFKALIATGASVPFVLIVFSRNYLFSGDIRGGNTKTITRPIAEIVQGFRSSIFSVLLGFKSKTALMTSPFFRIILVGFLLSVLLIVYYYFIKNYKRIYNNIILDSSTRVVCSFCLCYLAGFLYAARTSVISFDDPRILYPIYPMFLLLLGGVIANLPEKTSVAPARRFGHILLISSVVCYGVIHLESMFTLRPRTGPRILRATAGTVGDSDSLKGWLESHTTPHEPILAGDGQACGFITGRETISLVGTEYSVATWTEDRIRATSKQYGARFLVLFPNGDSTRTVAAESPFIHDLLNDELPPWISIVAKNDQIRIYKMVVN
jgi:hypothetical protein